MSIAEDILAVSMKQWTQLAEQVFRRDGMKCRYCGASRGVFAIDHVIPLERGGSNDLSNLVVACRACNSQKKDKLLSEWRI